jgi:hypothetical protein
LTIRGLLQHQWRKIDGNPAGLWKGIQKRCQENGVSRTNIKDEPWLWAMETDNPKNYFELPWKVWDQQGTHLQKRIRHFPVFPDFGWHDFSVLSPMTPIFMDYCIVLFAPLNSEPLLA